MGRWARVLVGAVGADDGFLEAGLDGAWADRRMGICCFFTPNGLELTLRFFNLREVFAENGIDVGAASSMSISRSGVLRRDAVDELASGADLGISSSLSGADNRPPEGDESGVE